MGRPKILRRAAYVLVGFNAFLLVVACVSYYRLFWPVLDLLSILAPLIWTVNTLAVLVLLLSNRQKARFPALALLLSFFCFGPYYQLGGPGERVGTEGFKIASFNSGNVREDTGNPSGLQAALESIQADIVCFQEFEKYGTSNIAGYPYRAFSPEVAGKSTQAIFSEFPIVGSGSIDFPDSSNNAIYGDVVAQGDTIRIYSAHLQSYRIYSEDLLYREYGGRFLRRFRNVAGQHVRQARQVKAHQSESPYPTVICGDFNATAFSHTYRILASGMNDSFGEAGTGLGATYSLRGLPFRIDYILADPGFEVLRHQAFPIRISDHRPVGAVLRFQVQ